MVRAVRSLKQGHSRKSVSTIDVRFIALSVFEPFFMNWIVAVV